MFQSQPIGKMARRQHQGRPEGRLRFDAVGSETQGASFVGRSRCEGSFRGPVAEQVLGRS